MVWVLNRQSFKIKSTFREDKTGETLYNSVIFNICSLKIPLNVYLNVGFGHWGTRRGK